MGRALASCARCGGDRSVLGRAQGRQGSRWAPLCTPCASQRRSPTCPCCGGARGEGWRVHVRRPEGLAHLTVCDACYLDPARRGVLQDTPAVALKRKLALLARRCGTAAQRNRSAAVHDPFNMGVPSTG